MVLKSAEHILDTNEKVQKYDTMYSDTVMVKKDEILALDFIKLKYFQLLIKHMPIQTLSIH